MLHDLLHNDFVQTNFFMNPPPRWEAYHFPSAPNHYEHHDKFHHTKEWSTNFVKSFLPGLLPLLLRQYFQKFAKSCYQYYANQPIKCPDHQPFVIKVRGSMRTNLRLLLEVLTDKT